ncbi:ComEC/Rec2 family competence protein [Sphingomonas lutea]|uniref:ComEC/Rec2 family competence protein n=1 Tax=Sphingomonas lutea TaxID=1045317 RepID=UPI001F18511D|nr:ComEC/Rec2 family competence protein [Sphingomonas lutea]
MGRRAAPRLDRPVVTMVSGTVERIDYLAAKGTVRLTLRADAPLPPRVRVTIDEEDQPPDLAPGAAMTTRARLAPPPAMALPGTYDFARDAWFRGIGGVGKALGPVTVTRPVDATGFEQARNALRGHIATSLPERPAGIAIALATGDQNSVDAEDAEAMRRSGLTHLLSVSGLHIAAVVAVAMWLALKLLALSERLALRFNLVLVAAGVGAAAGVGYTLLTGAQVPTVRSCIAALLVLAGIALGREAISIRLIAVGAIVVLLFRPEALAGASFQMSFAAVTALVALYSSRWGRRMLERRDEGSFARIGRALLAMVLTGLAVEAALIPMALYHFHRAGLYGVAANIAAIPLTTFVIMPAEAGALLLDSIGLGKPLWWVTDVALGALLGLAHWVASARGAVAMLPSMPGWAFGTIIAGGLWLCLWTSRMRLLGLVPALIGAIGAATAPTPDLLITGDGRHLAVVRADGTPMLLRERSGDYIRSVLAESAAFDGDPLPLGDLPGSDCSRDACVAELGDAGRRWRLLAIRSSQRIDWAALTRACAAADIAVADRRLPRGCTPRWLKLDRAALAQSGGVAIFLDDPPRLDTVADRVGDHPWGIGR